jgi:hypothetical protein
MPKAQSSAKPSVVLDENKRRFCANRQLSYQAIVGGHISHHPACAVEVHDDRRASFNMVGTNDAQAKRARTSVHTPVLDLHTWSSGVAGLHLQ